ncbi:phosphate signaling complex PhoU family protein [Olegusella massiliensis]|uniref:phosphate signaling complex PhoU family protein n=1 Tax=Olegusella massiliensis TaxID=1776381 RepID=UPI000837BED4|nr:PhoU domain-containing protein [Olegusella massiliensis]
MITRTVLTEQLDQILQLLSRYTKLTAKNIRLTDEAFCGDSEASEMILAAAKKGEKLRSDIESSCLDVLLLQQPLIGDDLRFVTASFRVVSDISRVDSMSRDIAFLVHEMPSNIAACIAEPIENMAELTSHMVVSAVDAFQTSDVAVAESVIASDQQINELYAQCEHDIVELIRSKTSSASYLPELLMIAKYFERIGDHAKRIASWAIFRATGRHRRGLGQVTDILFEDEGKDADSTLRG